MAEQGPESPTSSESPPQPHELSMPAPEPMPPYTYAEPSLSESDARMWSMLAYLGALLIGFISPLIVLLVMGPKSSFVKRNATEFLNFQITCFLATIVSLLLCLVLVGFLLLPVVIVYSLVITIVGAVKTYNGQEYRIPLNLRVIPA